MVLGTQWSLKDPYTTNKRGVEAEKGLWWRGQMERESARCCGPCSEDGVRGRGLEMHTTSGPGKGKRPEEEPAIQYLPFSSVTLIQTTMRE